MQREGADVGQEGGKNRGADTSTETLDKCRVLLQGRVEGLANREDIYCGQKGQNGSFMEGM